METKIFACNVPNLLLNYNGGMQIKKAEPSSFVQTVIKDWELALCWVVYLLQDSLLWVGRFGCKKNLAEAPGNRLNRKIDTLLGRVTGVG